MKEPQCRATQLVAFRAASVRRWDEATWTDVVASLPAEVRERMFPGGLPVSVGWVPEADMMALSVALHAGPCGRAEGTYRALLRGSIDEGFGRVRKLFMNLASPSKVLARAPELWQHDHSHGELVAIPSAREARVIVRHPVLLSTPLSCLTLAEMFRYILALTRVPEVTETHHRETAQELHIELRWKA